MYLLRLAVGGLTNCLANIDKDGAASMGFHLSPSTLKFDEYSGDWGVGFFAAARHASAFLVHDTELDQQLCFLCDIVGAEPTTGATTSTPAAAAPSSSSLPRASRHSSASCTCELLVAGRQ